MPFRAPSCLSWFQLTGSAQEQPQAGEQYQGLPFGGSELGGTASPEKHRALMGEELTLRMLWVTPPGAVWRRKDIVCSGYVAMEVQLFLSSFAMRPCGFRLFLLDYIPKPEK